MTSENARHVETIDRIAKSPLPQFRLRLRVPVKVHDTQLLAQRNASIVEEYTLGACRTWYGGLG